MQVLAADLDLRGGNGLEESPYESATQGLVIDSDD
jgi:hypothetical protein